jgi:hypothetical protein
VVTTSKPSRLSGLWFKRGLGSCALGIEVPGHHHGAALGAGVVAGVLAKNEVTTGWHGWAEVLGALGLGG